MSFIRPDIDLPLSVADGGTGTATPGLIAGAGITIGGPWPNQTISASGSQYPEVANYASLPAAAAHTNEIYVVLASTGVYFINRHPAGFYVSDGATWNYLGELTESYFNDQNLEFYDGTDPTKIARLQCDQISPSTSRTYTFPDQDGVFAMVSDIPAPGVSAVTASAPLASSGGLTPDISLSGIVPVLNGGTGTATPALVDGTNITITGTWPNQTINASGGVASVGASWKFNTSTAAADPGSKKFALDNASLALATALYVNDTTNENFDFSTLAAFIANGTRVYIQQKDDATRAALYAITGSGTDNGGWWSFPISMIANGGVLFQNNTDCGFVLLLNAATGGGGGAATTVEVDLGSTPVFRGRFTITDASIGTTSKVLCWQAPGPYTGKGTQSDEAEMAPVEIISVTPAAGSASVYWQTPMMVGAIPYSVSGGDGGRVNQLVVALNGNNAFSRVPVQNRRINKVRGNVKFSYTIFS